MALGRPFDDGRVQNANVALNASIVSAKIIGDSKFMFTGKQVLYFRHFRLDEAAQTGVVDQRERRKIAELHTSGAKRAETWQGGLKW